MAKVIVVALIGMTVAAAGPACAQGRGVELTPYVGIYVPLANVIDERTTQEMDGVIVGTETQAGHKTGLALGGRLTVWLSERIGAQGSFNYAFSDLGASGAHVWTAAGRLVYRLAQPNPQFSLELSGGPAIVGRGGAFYDLVESTTDVGGVLGVGGRIQVGGVALHLDLEDYLYSVQLEIPEVDSQFQNDLVFSVGVAIPLAR